MKEVLVTPHPCLALSHIMTFVKIGNAAARNGYHFSLLLSGADVDAVTEAGLDIGNMDILKYPGAFNRMECLDVAAQYAELQPLQVAMLYVDVGVKSCEALLSHPLLWDTLRTAHFDVFFGDLSWPCSSLVADKLDQDDDSSFAAATPLPRVMFQGNIAIDPWCELYGVPSPANEITQILGTGHYFLPDKQETMSFGKRLLNIILREVARWTVNLVMLRPYTALRAQAGLKPVDMHASAQVSEAIILLPAVWGIEPPRALPPNWKAIHPILPSPANAVVGPLADFIDRQCVDKGLVLISFGTQASVSLDQVHKIGQAVEALKDFCFLWRLPSSSPRPPKFSQHLDNVKIVEWLPQNDLLGHSQIHAFVSHVGYGSLYEAAYHGVPIIGIPMFGDQDDNIHRAVRSGFGVRLDKNGFTSSELVKAVQQAGSMKSQAMKWSQRVRAKSGVEEAMEWIEYADVHGVQHLLPIPSMKASYVAYYNLDVGLVLCTMAFAVCCGVWFIVRRKFVTRSREKEKTS